MKVYLAGPDVFRQDAIQQGKFLKQILEAHGHEGLYPMDNEFGELTGPEAAKFIFNANKKMIESCDVVLANIIPFRGPSADPGTVWEMGYGLGLGKTVITYGIDSKDIYKKRVVVDSMHIEDFGLYDNLMIVYGAHQHFELFYEAVLAINQLKIKGK